MSDYRYEYPFVGYWRYKTEFLIVFAASMAVGSLVAIAGENWIDDPYWSLLTALAGGLIAGGGLGAIFLEFVHREELQKECLWFYNFGLKQANSQTPPTAEFVKDLFSELRKNPHHERDATDGS